MKSIVIAGVDGGASSTRCLAVETGSWRVAACKSGPSNILSAGPETTLFSVEEAFNGALRKLGCDKAEVAALCLSGAWTAGRRLEKLFKGKIRAGKILVKSDVEAAAAACLGLDEQGIIVIAGTGSVVLGVSGGSFFRAGGWGHVVNDEGGAYFVSIEALRAAFQSYDGRGSRTSLEEEAKKFFKARSMEELARLVHEMGKEHIALFAKKVKAEAENGDIVARRIIEDAAKSLSKGVLAVARKMKLTRGDELNIYLVGGMFNGHPDILVRRIRKHLSLEYGKIKVRRPAYPPAVGALLIAFREAGLNPPARVLKKAASMGCE
ncbi:MAG: BadF/BadG/BcrA/BcrD ATPase family protein [Thermoproteota archaeon]